MRFKRKKDKFTVIEIVVTIIVMGILTGLALPKMSGFKSNSDVYSINLDLQILDMAVKLYNASSSEYPLKDLNNDRLINNSDLFYYDSPMPSDLKNALESKLEDTGENIYELDIDKLTPFINGLNCEDKTFLYSTETNTVINPFGQIDGNGNNHFFIK